MIDDPKQVEVLMQKMKAHLPISVKATDILMSSLRKNSIKISLSTHIEIVDVMYMGDEGGICCALKLPGQEENAVVVSLTHVRIQNANPMSPDILAYQRMRVKKLARH